MVFLMKVIVFPVCFCCHVPNIKKQLLKGFVKVIFFFFFSEGQNEQLIPFCMAF